MESKFPLKDAILLLININYIICGNLNIKNQKELKQKNRFIYKFRQSFKFVKQNLHEIEKKGYRRFDR